MYSIANSTSQLRGDFDNLKMGAYQADHLVRVVKEDINITNSFQPLIQRHEAPLSENNGGGDRDDFEDEEPTHHQEEDDLKRE